MVSITTTPSLRRRLGATAAATLAVAMAVSLDACGSGTRTVTQSGPPRSSPVSPASTTTASTTATAAREAPTHFVRLQTFQSPSGNIGCVIAGGLARCDIVQRSWQPPSRPASCPSEVDFGQGVEVDGHAPGRLVCAGDTARDPSSSKLGYGTATRAEGFVCVSRRTGMTCTATGTEHGFDLSRQGYRLF